MRVEPIPCLSDNYAYLVIDDEARVAAVVDAAEPAPVFTAVARAGVPLVAVLSTHHHGDHVGGNADLVATDPGLAVYGSLHDRDRIPGLTRALEDGERFRLGTLEVRALHVPGHTLGALTYVVRGPAHGGAPGPAWAFTGDTLFLGGCGRLFEGTKAMMHRSLSEVIGALPPDTLVACGHEYTESNLRFARHVEPDNPQIAARARRVSEARGRGEPSVPGTLAEEHATNPFLRVAVPAVRAHVGLGEDEAPEEVLGRLRDEKDSFRG